MDLIDIYRTFHSKAEEYTFFSSACERFSRIAFSQLLCHKRSLSIFNKILIISSLHSNKNAKRLEISYKKKLEKNTITWRLNNMSLNNQWVTEEDKKEIKKKIPRDRWKWKHDDPKPIGCYKSSSKNDVCSNTILLQGKKIQTNLNQQTNKNKQWNPIWKIRKIVTVYRWHDIIHRECQRCYPPPHTHTLELILEFGTVAG